MQNHRNVLDRLLSIYHQQAPILKDKYGSLLTINLLNIVLKDLIELPTTPHDRVYVNCKKLFADLEKMYPSNIFREKYLDTIFEVDVHQIIISVELFIRLADKIQDAQELIANQISWNALEYRYRITSNNSRTPRISERSIKYLSKGKGEF